MLRFLCTINISPQKIPVSCINFLSRYSDPWSILFHFPEKVSSGDFEFSPVWTGCPLSVGKLLFKWNLVPILRNPPAFLIYWISCFLYHMFTSFLVYTLILWRTSSSSFLEQWMGNEVFEIPKDYYLSFSDKIDSLAE